MTPRNRAGSRVQRRTRTVTGARRVTSLPRRRNGLVDVDSRHVLLLVAASGKFRARRSFPRLRQRPRPRPPPCDAEVPLVGTLPELRADLVRLLAHSTPTPPDARGVYTRNYYARRRATPTSRAAAARAWATALSSVTVCAKAWEN